MDIGDFKLSGLAVLDQASIHTVQAYKSIEVKDLFILIYKNLHYFVQCHSFLRIISACRLNLYLYAVKFPDSVYL